jgi:hypothetical protein
VVNNEVYEKTLDVLFPERNSSPKNIISTTVLRFEPTFESESELVLRETFDSSEILYYKATEGNIYHRLNEVIQGGSPADPVLLSKKINITAKKILIPKTLFKNWNSTMFEGIRLSTKTLDDVGEQQRGGAVSIPLDGTVYVLKYTQGTNDFSLKLYDVDSNRPNVTPQFKIVQWMIGVHEYVNSH